MRTGIATVCLSGTLKEKMQACAVAGFDGIEIFEQDLVTSSLSPEEIRAMAADLGLSLDLYQPFRDFDSVPEELLAANLRRAEAKFRLMSRLGMDTILVCSNVATASIDDDDLRAAQLSRLADLAGEHGVKVAYEALAWGKYVNDYEHAHRLVELVDHPNLGTCLDSFHILSRDWDTAPIEQFNPEKIFFVQVADAPKLSMDVLSWSRHYRVFPGEGQFELAKFMGHVVRAGYTGPVSLEVFNDVFRQSDVERTAVDAMRSLIWLEEQSAQWLETHPSSAQPAEAAGGAGRRRYPMELATLPRVAEPAGFNFAEVRAADTAAPGDPAGPAGVRVQRPAPDQECAIVEHGPRTRDHQRGSARRGGDRHCRGRLRRRLPGDRRRPGAAAQGPGRAAQEPGERGNFPGLRRPGFHRDLPVPGQPGRHRRLGQRIRRRLRRRSRPGRGPAGRDRPRQPRPAVAALRRGRAFLHQRPGPGAAAVRRGGQPHRAGPLPGDDHAGPRRAAGAEPGPAAPAGGRPGRRRRSPGTQRRTYQEHIAFAVDDLVATARAARGRGLEFLQIPANYYEDLDARFDLDPAFLATLRELNLLYDRDADGEFLHFYTATVGSVFFEMVERRGSYDGYGAPNAPVRHAVQYDHLHQLKLTA